MSQAQAEAFLDKVEDDEGFAKELEAVRENPPAVIERVHAAGFDATPEEIREAFLERYGSELTPEQLDAIAAGSDAAIVGGVTAAVTVVWLGASAAAVCA